MSPRKSYVVSLTIICSLFFFFGFMTWINGVLIPYFQICLELSNVQASLVLFAAYSAYFVMALPCAWILKRIKYRKGMVLGLVIMAFGTVLFIPAAYTRTYGLFLFGLYLTGTGLTLLQAAAFQWVNPKAWAMALGAVSAYSGTGDFAAILSVGMVFSLVNLPCIAVWVVAGEGVRHVLTNPNRLAMFNWTMAVLLVLSVYPVLNL